MQRPRTTSFACSVIYSYMPVTTCEPIHPLKFIWGGKKKRQFYHIIIKINLISEDINNKYFDQSLTIFTFNICECTNVSLVFTLLNLCKLRIVLLVAP